MKHTTPLPAGVKIILGFHLLTLILWTIGQGGAVVSYDAVAAWGFQDPRDSLGPAIVEVNRGSGFSDCPIQTRLLMRYSL